LEKLITYWRVHSNADGTIAPWERLASPPTSQEGPYGDLKVENDDQIMLIFFVDENAHEKVVRGARDAAALAQEHGIPHRSARG
jgi:hypothetical protein